MIITSTTRTHADTYRVNSEIAARLSGAATGPLSDSAALTIAGEYAVHGSALAQLASTGQADSDDLFRAIGDVVTGGGLHEREYNELLALFAWITTRPRVADTLL